MKYETVYDRIITWYSQLGQDQWVIRTLKGKENGTFLDIGAYDGKYHSNTLALENDFGWTGWLIEALRAHANRAQCMRHAQVVNVAVGPDENQRAFYVAEQWSGLRDFIRPNLLAGHQEHHNPLTVIHTTPLAKLLRNLHVPPVIDYLSIDVEGAEYPILKSYFMDPPVRFRCMTIEIGVNADHLNQLCTLLEPFGYRLETVRDWEAFFVHPLLVETANGKSDN